MPNTKTVKPVARKRRGVYHPITVETRKRLAKLKHTGEWKRIAKRAKVSYRTICAIGEGELKEMRLTRELALASAVGIEVKVRLTPLR